MATDDTSPTPAALSFGAVAEAYDRGRAGYPREAVEWLVGEEPLTVLELGAGTGRLTEHLVALGHDVHATDPDPRMLDRLALRLPEMRVSQTSAEEIPAADATYDVVVAADAFEWFDHERALPEIARVLKRGGTFAIMRNVRDERIPWVKRLGNLIGHHTTGMGAGDELEASPYFGPADEATFKQWHVIDRSSVQDLVRSLPDVAGLERTGQESRVREVLAFYDDFGRGMDGMQLPYVTECFRAVVGIQPKTIRQDALVQAGPAAPAASGDDTATPEQPSGYVGEDTVPISAGGAPVPPAVEPPADDDSGMLLIDFR
ncbi:MULTISPECIES: class I SAM-dependent methyltransferase [unclassified Nocardioides]|uniref:class I SAM-dependent methyltransferase n=1 Tax=unclassified Nocardioides TaxID=2615069 RepID=UPI0009E71A33|nr:MULTISPECIES: class I SAM-dependent methyltransferase [unclassified Nocardioides]